LAPFSTHLAVRSAFIPSRRGLGAELSESDASASLMKTGRENKWIPRMPMWPLFYRVMSRGLSSAAEEAGIPYWHVIFAGYLWHYVVGVTFGVAHMMLFGSANLAITLGWGIFIWAVMMTVMPSMMPMVKLPYPRFMVIPFIAHVAFSLPVWWVASSLITPAAHASSLLGALRSP